MGEYYTPIKFWFSADSTVLLPSKSIVNELNRLLKEDPEKYNEGYRYIDVEEYGFGYNNSRIQLHKLDKDGKIIFKFAPIANLIFIN